MTGQKSVLVVEDESDISEVVSLILQFADFEVKTADDEQQAIEILGQFKPDAILTDLQMPRIDGLELIKHVRNDSQLRRVPIIAMTACCNEIVSEEALRLGATKIIFKPLDNDMLVALIKQHLNNGRDRSGESPIIE